MTVFPLAETDFRVRLDLDGSGTYATDITAYVQQPPSGPAVKVGRGASAEGSVSSVASAAFGLQNDDRRFSPGNASGPYYGQLGRNTGMQVDIPHIVTRLDVPIAVPVALTTPDTAALSVTGDIDVRVDLEPSDWLIGDDGCFLLHKWTVTSNQRSWGVYLTDDGRLSWYWTTDGSTVQHVESTSVVPRGPKRATLRVTHDVNNGSSGNDVTFYVGTSRDATSWTQIGDVVTSTGTTSIYDSTADLAIGDTVDEGGRGAFQVFGVQVRDGIGSTLVSDLDLTSIDEGATTIDDDQGNTWTPAIEAELQVRDRRFTGVIPSWSPTGGPRADDSQLSITAYDVLRRLGRSKGSELSTYRRAATAVDSSMTDLRAYIPMEDAQGSARLASGLPDRPSFRITGDPSLASNSEFACSDALLVTSTDFKAAGKIPPYSDSGEWQAMLLVKIPASAVSAKRRIFTIVTNSSSAMSWHVSIDNVGNLYIDVEDSGGSNVLASVGGFGANGKLLRLYLSVQQDGSDVDWTLSPLEAGERSTTFISGTVTSVTAGRPVWGAIAPDAQIDQGVVGHLTVQSTVTSLFALHEQLAAYGGETASERVRRLANEAALPVVTRGEGGQRLGVQAKGKLIDQLRKAEEADGGMLYTPRHTDGIVYRALRSMLTRDPVVEVAYTDAGARGLRPIIDDQQAKNLITITRVGGSSHTIEQTTGPMSTQDRPYGIGVYDASSQMTLSSDENLPDRASWELHTGTLDEPRFPGWTFDLGSEPHLTGAAAGLALATAIRSLDIGDRVLMPSPPEWCGPDDVDQIVIGLAEELGVWWHHISPVCRPASAYRAGVWQPEGSTSTDSLWSSPGSTLAVDTTWSEVDLSGSECLSVSGDGVGSDLIVIVLAALDDWTDGEQVLASKYVNSGNQRSWAFDVNGSGYPHLYWSEDGATYNTAVATASPGLTDGQFYWLKVSLDIDNGSGLYEVRFYYSTDGVTYTQIGSTVTGASTTSIYDSTADYQLGARSGTSVTSAAVGVIRNVYVLDGFGAGPAEPTEDSVGADMDTTWTVQNGNLYIDSGPADYEDYKFQNCRVRVRTSAAITFTNCWFAGNSSLTTEHGLLDCTHADVADVTVTNCTFDPETPTGYMTGVLGHHFEVYNSLIKHCVDGVGVYDTSDPTADTGVIVQGCWIGKHGWYYPDPAGVHGDGSHTDGCQIQGGSGTQLIGNKFSSYHDSSIGNSPWSRVSDPQYRCVSSLMIGTAVGDVTDLYVANNWFDGGEISLNGTHSGNNGNDLGTITGNRWYDTQYYDTYTIDIHSGSDVDLSDNTYVDGSELTIRQGSWSNPIGSGGTSTGENLVPVEPDDWTEGYSGSGTGASPAAQTDSLLTVDTIGGALWGHVANYDVRVSGKTLSITAAPGNSSPQVLSATPSTTDGVNKTLLSGEGFALASAETDLWSL